MKISELIIDSQRPFLEISPKASVEEALGFLNENKVSALMVMAGDNPCGIFTERDLVRCHMAFPGELAVNIKVERVMTRDLVVAQSGDSVEDAMAMMIKAGIRHLPVIENGHLCAMFSLEDLVKSHVGTLTQELHYLKEYISDLQDAAYD